MEFVGNFTTLYVNRICSEIIYNCKRFPVIKVGFFTPDEGKFETDNYIVKFSKKLLYLYNRETKELIDTFAFTCFKTITLNSALFVDPNVPEPVNDEVLTLVKVFVYFKDWLIKLYMSGENKYVIFNNNVREDVVTVSSVGSTKLYITDHGNELGVATSSSRQNQWNGVPIGVFSGG